MQIIALAGRYGDMPLEIVETSPTPSVNPAPANSEALAPRTNNTGGLENL